MKKKYNQLTYKMIKELIKNDYLLSGYESESHKTTKYDDKTRMKICFHYDDKTLIIDTYSSSYFVYGSCYGFIGSSAMMHFAQIIQRLEQFKIGENDD